MFRNVVADIGKFLQVRIFISKCLLFHIYDFDFTLGFCRTLYDRGTASLSTYLRNEPDIRYRSQSIFDQTPKNSFVFSRFAIV